MESSTKDVPATETPVIRFAAVVQYLDGNADKLESRGSRIPLQHNMALYEGERLAVSSGSTVKIVTRAGCIIVLHGDAQAFLPQQDKPWRIKASALRVICPSGTREKFTMPTARFEVGDASEALIDGKRLLLLAGTATTSAPSGGSQTFIPLHFYQYRAKAWQLDDSPPSATDIWQFNKNRRPPQESTRLPEPPAPASLRFIFGPIHQLGGHLWYNDANFDQSVPDGDGGRLIFQRPFGKGSAILSLAFFEKRDNDKSGARTSPYIGASTQLSQFSVEGGYRFSHDSVLAPYFRFGLGFERAKMASYDNQSNSYYRIENEFYFASATFGADAIYSPPWLSWLGLYAAAEAQVTQSLGRGARQNLEMNSGSSSSKPSPPELWRLTEASLHLMLGLVLQF